MSDAATADLVDVPMPQLGVSVTEGTVVAWSVAVGDQVEADQPLCDIATDKVDSEIPAPVGGTVTEILARPGDTVAVGTVLARVATGGGEPGSGPRADAAQVVAACDDVAVGATDAPGHGTADETVPAAGRPEHGVPAREGAHGSGRGVPGGARRRRHSPVVLRIAEEAGIDLSGIPGTGRGGRVTKRDVLRFLEGSAGTQAPAATHRTPAHAVTAPSAPVPDRWSIEPLPRAGREATGGTAHSASTAAHAHLWVEVDMDRVERQRRRTDATVLAFVARAAVAALRAHPAVNAWVRGDARVLHQDVDLGVTVESGEGETAVPVIPRAQELSLEGLAAGIREAAARARRGRIGDDAPTFTIADHGGHGALITAPALPSPQAAVLGVAAMTKRPVVMTDPEGRDAVAIRSVSVLGLTWDRRAFDEGLAGRFLLTVRDTLERWPGPSPR